MARTEIRASAIIIKGNKILLIHRRKNGEEYWVFPGGGIEDTDESWEKACIREVKEETNLDVRNIKLAFMSTTFEGGNEHPFYFCEVADGEAKIIGEEAERNSKENWYKLEWISFSKLESLTLYPENAKVKVIKLYTKDEAKIF